MGTIRLLLALAVFLSHMPGAPFTFISGGTAVQAFFVVSGFYMALILDGKYPTTRLFYGNRLLRLAPAYYAICLLALVMLIPWEITATATLDLFRQAYSNPFTATIMVFETILVVGQDLLYWFMLSESGALEFDPLGGMPTESRAVAFQALLVPQSWSLSLELLFYLIAPWLARRSTAALFLIAAASIALRLAGTWFPVEFPLWQGRFFPTCLFMFVFGMLGYRLYPRVSHFPPAVQAGGTAALAAVVMLMPLTGLTPDAQRWIVYVSTASLTPFAFALTHRMRFDRWIGELSYPIYLTHLLAIAVVLHFELPMPVLSAIAITLLASVAVRMLIEDPVDRWRQRRVAREVLPG